MKISEISVKVTSPICVHLCPSLVEFSFPFADLFLWRVLQNKFQNRRGIIQSVRVMPHARLGDERDDAAQLLVTLGHDGGVFFVVNHIVGLAVDVEQGNVVLGEGREVVDGIFAVGERLGVVFEMMGGEELLPFGGAALAFTPNLSLKGEYFYQDFGSSHATATSTSGLVTLDQEAHLKSHLIQRFEQLEIYVTSHPIDVH